MQFRYIAAKLAEPGRLKKIAAERLTEPVHLNIASLAVAAFGPYATKVAFDLVPRPQYAWGLLAAARLAKQHDILEITVVELGVASGAGLINMAYLADRTSKATGVRIKVVGFDTGLGLPPTSDYRDHPELYQGGDYPMNEGALRSQLPDHAELIIGAVGDTIPPFLESGCPPIGFIALDVDLYTSSVDALALLAGPPDRYLPVVSVFVDDMHLIYHHPWAGELLAIEEFNAAHDLRKIHPHIFLRAERAMKNAAWIDHVYLCQIIDHEARKGSTSETLRAIENPYATL